MRTLQRLRIRQRSGLRKKVCYNKNIIIENIEVTVLNYRQKKYILLTVDLCVIITKILD